MGCPGYTGEATKQWASSKTGGGSLAADAGEVARWCSCAARSGQSHREEAQVRGWVGSGVGGAVGFGLAGWVRPSQGGSVGPTVVRSENWKISKEF